jgi:chromosomal replication initiation ATPase DnaA
MYQLADPQNKRMIQTIQFILKKEYNVISEKNEETINYFIEDVINLCAKNLGVETAQLKSKKRDKRIVIARQLAQYIVKEHARFLTLETVALKVGNRDHSTVIHSIKAINNIIETKDRVYFDIVKQTVNQVIAKWKIDSKDYKSKLINL